VRMALPGPWSPLANGTLMARRAATLLDAKGPSVRETYSDLEPSGLERVTGIEPALSAWEADVLPLNYTRASLDVAGWRESRGACPDIVPEGVGCSRAPI
jgi:hypothetical protein